MAPTARPPRGRAGVVSAATLGLGAVLTQLLLSFRYAELTRLDPLSAGLAFARNVPLVLAFVALVAPAGVSWLSRT